MLKRAVSSFTRPVATATYSIGDVVANSATAGSVVPLSWTLGGSGANLVWARLVKTDQTDIALSTFDLRLYGATPAPTAGDDAAFAGPVADFIGILSFPIMVAGTDDAYTTLRVGDTGFLYPWALPYAQVFGLLIAKGAYTAPASEVFTVTLGFEK